MRKISQIEFALPSLAYSLLMGFITLIHHLHSGIVLHPGSGSLHVVFNEAVLIPATCVSMHYYARKNSKIAFWIYLLIALLGFIFLGLYEGGWNHTVQLIAYLRLNTPTTEIRSLLPDGNLHLWFYEITGVLTFASAMVASWYSARFYLANRK